jgi:hypothetical protein
MMLGLATILAQNQFLDDEGSGDAFIPSIIHHAL